MHLVIPFASPGSESGREALAGLALPRLEALLGRWREVARDEGDVASLSPPHERAIARALGWPVADGRLPWAARDAAAAGLDTSLAWGLLTPVHWQVGSDQVSLVDPDAVDLAESDSRALFDAVAPLFDSEGFKTHWLSALRWLVAHESLAGLPTASLDRVIGRSVDLWPLPRDARLVKRLQNEAQMLLHGHPVNEAREAAGMPTVNSVVLSGCGRLPGGGSAPRVDLRLRSPALAEDWASWRSAWQALDAALPDTGRLTLCGERSALELEAATPGLWQRLTRKRPSARETLEAL